MAKTLNIYNLKFEWPDEKMVIEPYVFTPAEGYRGRYLRLQHLVDVGGGYCGSTKAVTGEHQVTGSVLLPDGGPPAALGWGYPNPTALDDILLLLSIFTGRKVFALDPAEAEGPIIADPRKFHYGGGVALSLGKVRRTCEDGFDEYALDLAMGTSRILGLIRSTSWRSTYRDGRFLFTFAAACPRQILETSFLLCWTTWEHLFALHHASTMTQREIENTPAKKKIADILTRYVLRKSVPATHERKLGELVRTRNSLVHNGNFPTPHAEEVADIFIRLTEMVIARVLGLTPSTVFSADERFECFLDERQLI